MNELPSNGHLANRETVSAAAALGLKLPAHLQRTSGGTAERQHISRQDVGAGKTVTLDRVDMGRNGWRYEVNAEYERVDADGPVIRRDTLWLPDYEQARKLMRAAATRLLAGSAFHTDGGLSGLARQLDLRFSAS